MKSLADAAAVVGKLRSARDLAAFDRMLEEAARAPAVQDLLTAIIDQVRKYLPASPFRRNGELPRLLEDAVMYAAISGFTAGIQTGVEMSKEGHQTIQ